MRVLDLEDIQGIFARGYGPLGESAFLVLGFGSGAEARSWLRELLGRLTSASARPRTRAVNVALSLHGLEMLGLDSSAREGFSEDFRSGMVTEHKSRILGDHGASAPENWIWGGSGEAPVDALVMVYADEPSALEAALEGEERAAKEAGFVLRHSRRGSALPGAKEHFGFRDGISQPFIQELKPSLRHPHPVALGEFLLGHPNAYGRFTQRALIPATQDPRSLLEPAAEAPGMRDFCLNGSYLVIRDLEQDVPRFWQFVKEASASGKRGMPPIKMAAKMVGRWPGGAPLAESPDRDDPSLERENGFGYHANDADGRRCPFGAHIRRTNPRDSLDPEPGSRKSIAAANRHRILRRGRSFGPPLPAAMDLAGEGFAADDGNVRGLVFACLNANLRRQFEFVQHTWSNNPNFAGRYSETDPITGDRFAQNRDTSEFSIPAEPIGGCLHGLPDFVTVRGGAYFFLPSFRALRYLVND